MQPINYIFSKLENSQLNTFISADFPFSSLGKVIPFYKMWKRIILSYSSLGGYLDFVYRVIIKIL